MIRLASRSGLAITLASALLTAALVGRALSPDPSIAPEVIRWRAAEVANSRSFHVVDGREGPAPGTSNYEPRAALETPSTNGADLAALALAQQLTARSDAVVVGRVERTQAFPLGPSGEPGIHTLVELSVQQVLSGRAGASLSFWVHGGKLGGRIRVLSQQAHYAAGEELVMFLSRHGRLANTVLWPTDMGLGKWRVEQTSNGRFAVPTARLSQAVKFETLAAQLSVGTDVSVPANNAQTLGAHL